MHVFLYAVVAWIAVDVALVLAWHYAHLVSRRGGRVTPATATATVGVVAQHVDLVGSPHPSRSRDLAGSAPQLARTADPLRLVDA